MPGRPPAARLRTMLSPLPFVLVVAIGLIVGSFYYWARRQGLLAAGPAAGGEQGRPRVSLLTEAVAYVGAVLLLAGGIAAVGRRWDELGGWGRAGVLAGAGVLFLAAGILVRRASEPALQRLAGVMGFLSAVAGAPARVAERRPVRGAGHRHLRHHRDRRGRTRASSRAGLRSAAVGVRPGLVVAWMAPVR